MINRHLCVALAASLAACAPDGAPKTLEARTADGAPAPNRIEIVASDFHFEAPATVPAGLTTLHLVNHGPEFHHVQLIRLNDGHTLEDVRRWAASHTPMPEWMHAVGGPNTPRPGGGESEVTLDLPAGEYALLCVIPSKNGVPHFALGMMQRLTVTEPAAPRPALTADVEMTLNDYGFATSAPIAAGRRTIRVRNAGPQPHEVIMVRLAPGKTPADVLAFIESGQGDPPGEPVGGTTMLASGEENYVTGDFAAGEYALLCLIPDRGDGRPHVAHGMVRQVTVQ